MHAVAEIAHFEVMRLVLDPDLETPDGVPDPADSFEGCVNAMVDVVERDLYALPRAERDAYVLERARTALAWCRQKDAPPSLTRHVEKWVRRVSA